MTDPIPVPAAMQALRDALSRVEAFVMARPGLSDQERARGLYYATAWLMPMMMQAMGNCDPQNPIFFRQQDWVSKVGLDNPDNLYGFAQISDEGEYRIWGHRGDANDLIFQTIAGTPGDGSLGIVHDTLDAGRLLVEPDGRFEIIVSAEQKGRNWMKLGPGTSCLLARQTFSDWSQSKSELFIERIDRLGTSSPVPDEAEMARRIAEAGRLMVAYVEYFWDFTVHMTGSSPVNAIPPPYATQGGIAGQYITNGQFQLTDDEALVVTFEPWEARYFGILLADPHWFITLDYRTHQTNLSVPGSARPSPDGRYRFIVSARDPAVANWLDTTGRDSGIIFLRWQGLAGEPPRAPQVERVAFDALADHLAAEPRITVEQRQAALTARRHHIDRRFGL